MLILRSAADIKKIKDSLANRAGKRNFDAKRFCGALKTSDDGLSVQKRLRREWN